MKCLVNRKELLSELKFIDKAFKQNKQKNDITNNVRIIVKDDALVLFVWGDGRMYKTWMNAEHIDGKLDTALNIRAFKEAVNKMQDEVIELLYITSDYTLKVIDNNNTETLHTIQSFLYPGDIFLHPARRIFHPDSAK